jgi:N-acetyl-anhydromuramyl-L-alanine amidase AmpD
MRKINMIVIHCSATLEGKAFNAAAIDAMHKQRGFKKIGYHFVVGLDGKIEEGRKLDEVGAHAQGYNANSIGICYIGGIGRNAKGNLVGKDTRTQLQKDAMANLVRQMKLKFPNARVLGHRDLSPDLNKDGKITSEEFIKECPCFNAIPEYDGVHSDTAKGGKLRSSTVSFDTAMVDPGAPGASVADAGGEARV